MINYIYKHERLKMAALAITFDAGSELELTGKKGTMHLMEHLICKTFEELYKFFTANSINWNAYTSEERVMVYFEGLASRLTPEVKMKIAERLVGGINIKQEVFNNEKNVVLQEYMDCVNDNAYACELNVFRKYWNDYTPIGKESDIRNFSYDDMFETYEKYFRKPIRIVEVGPEKTPGLEALCKEVDYKPEHKKLKFGKYEFEKLSADTSLKVPVFLMSPKAVSASDYPYLKIGMLTLTGGLESPFYQKLRVENGLSYYVRGGVTRNINSGMLVIDACTNTERAEELGNKMLELSGDLYNIMTKERFDDIIESIKIEREKEKILKYAYIDKYASITKLKLPKNLDKIEFEKTRYLLSRYFANIKLIRGDKL